MGQHPRQVPSHHKCKVQGTRRPGSLVPLPPLRPARPGPAPSPTPSRMGCGRLSYNLPQSSHKAQGGAFSPRSSLPPTPGPLGSAHRLGVQGTHPGRADHLPQVNVHPVVTAHQVPIVRLSILELHQLERNGPQISCGPKGGVALPE